MTVTVDAIELRDQHCSLLHDAGKVLVTVVAQWVPRRSVDGSLTDIDGNDLALLRFNGWAGEQRTDLAYDETSDGGSPSIADIGSAMLTALAAQATSLKTAWVGKTVTMSIT